MLKTIQKNLHGIRNSLFKQAMAAEYKRAGLHAAVASLSFGKITYLETVNQTKRDTIVMLHGFGADKTSWVRLAKLMGSTRRIVIPDLAGHGESTQDISLEYGIAQQVVYLHEFLQKQGIEKAHLIANSMGCAIALRYASINPKCVASLILMDAAGVERTPGKLAVHMAKTGKNPMIEIDSVDAYRAMMRYGMESPPYIPRMFINLLAEEKIKRREIERKMILDVEKDLNQIPILGKIEAPTLIIWGAQDRIVHFDDAALLHESIACSKKIIIKGIGHVPMVENPKLVAAHCVKFLNEIAK